MHITIGEQFSKLTVYLCLNLNNIIILHWNQSTFIIKNALKF